MGDNAISEKNPASPDLTLASQYALRVALQTMKERCVSLHQRLSQVEEENQDLRSRLYTEAKPSINAERGQTTSNFEELKQQISELSCQNLQLNEHISIIATENDQLWSRLSQLSKDHSDGTDGRICGQNLIRSRTFTQHAPNPNLRHKIVHCDNLVKFIDNISLEEVALYNEKDYQASINVAIDENHVSPEVDLTQETNNCIDGFHDLKKELMKQQNDLKITLTSLKRKFDLKESAECTKKHRKPETADKSLETDDSITEMKGNLHKQNSSENAIVMSDKRQPDSRSHIDILEQKRLADENDKMCPLCGRIFNSLVSFDDFREHVEEHFIDDAELEPSVEHNFELVSHTVGNF